MKRILRKFFIIPLFLLVILSIYQVNVVSAVKFDTSEIVMDTLSKRVLYSKNIYDKKYMASTTKILTAITIIENCDLRDIVTVTEKSVGIEGSSIYLKAGDKLTVKDLLYGLMLRSGNDCAETLALYCSGSIDKFAELMNKTAEKIGTVSSNFVNPHGLHNDNHYTTAYDLALISCYAIKNEIFREIVSSKSVDISFIDKNEKKQLINKNKMLTRLDGCTGIKTGYTKKAGRCLVTSCKRGEAEYVCIVLNCPSMWETTESLINDVFEKYKYYTLAEKKNIVGFITGASGENFPLCIKNDVILPLSDYEAKNLKTIYDYPTQTDKPLDCDKEIGAIKFYNEKDLLFFEKIYTITAVR